MSTEPDLIWAVWDAEGQAWMGQKDGPRLFQNSLLNGQPLSGEHAARFAAGLLNENFQATSGRFRAMPYDGTGTRWKDTITAP